MSATSLNAATSSKIIVPVIAKKKPPPPKRQIHPIIEIVNGIKHYGFCGRWHQVLRKFNIAVYGGEVYALLGPHGCGKSTALNIILGFTTLNVGQVTVFGFKPGHELSGIPGIRVGYTPQSGGLYPEFTIYETLRYYGALLRLDRDYIMQRMAFLSTLLALPDEKQFIGRCTEGTKRQISFAVALLHEPELLILDEPCAGIDPVLRRGMWEHMKQLAKEEITILVTTQSCEEAKLADKVGFMRRGHLLLDGNPRELLKIHKEKQLESLYRRVYSSGFANIRTTSSVQENPIIKLELLNVTSSEGFLYTGGEASSNESISTKPSKYGKSNTKAATSGREACCECSNFRRLGVLITRDLLRSMRSYIWLILFLVIPPLFLTVFCVTIGTTPSSLYLAVVNLEATEEDCFVNPGWYISCQVLGLLDRKIIKQVAFSTVKSAWKAAHDLEVSAILIIRKDFTEYINRAFSQIILGKNDHPIDHVPITLHLDLSSKIVANTIESTIKIAIEKYLQQAMKGTQVEESGLGYPMKISAPIFGTSDTTDTDYMGPGLSITFIYHLAAFVAAITLVTDRVNKLAQRDYLAGVHLEETVVSQMIIYGTVSMLQAILLFVVLLGIFHMPCNGSLWYVALIVIIQIWCGIAFGTFVAMMSKSTVAAGLCVFCCVVASLILCGIQWPLNGLPSWLFTVIEFLPQTRSIEAVRTILQRGTDITHKLVWSGLVIPLCWLFVFTLCYGIANKRV